MEENFFGDEITVNYSVWEKERAGDSHRTSELEVFVQED